MVIAIEGGIRSGKTTANKKFEAEGCSIVWEYGHYAGGKFPVFPQKSLTESVQASQYFIGLESQRIADLNSFKDNANYIILDRTYHSCIAADFAVDAINETNFLEQALFLWGEAEKIIPDITILLYVDYVEMLRRLEPTKKFYNPIFYSKEFNENLYSYYRRQNFIEIDTSNMYEDEVFKKIKSILF